MSKYNNDRYKTASRERLSKIIETKIRTSFIGAISSFEDEFGHMWGKDTDNPNIEQRRMKNVWDMVRKEILDKGNDQIRNAKTELEYYDIIWNRYTTEFRQPGDNYET